MVFFLEKLPIFKNDLKSFFELIIFLLLISIFLLKLLESSLQTFVFLLQVVASLNFILKFLICLCQLDLDEVYFLLALLQMRLDAIFRVVGDFVVYRKEGIVV